MKPSAKATVVTEAPEAVSARVIRTALESLLQTQSTVQIVQVGAHIGDTFNDPLNEFLRIHASGPNPRVSALLIEPVPFLFKKLVETYRGYRNVVLENVAISDRDGIADFYCLPENIRPAELGLPEWIDQLGSLRSDRMTKLWDRYESKHHSAAKQVQEFYLKHRITKSVQCMTLENVLAKHSIINIDLLNLDTEGHDFAILKTINFKQIKPTFINYERVLLFEEEPKCRKLLVNVGYELGDYGQDTFCTRTDFQAVPFLPLQSSPELWQMHPHEKLVLHSLVTLAKPGVALEIGSHRGESLKLLSEHCQKKAYSIDIDPDVKKHISSGLQKIEFRTGYSSELIPKTLAEIDRNKEELGLILLDGDHSTSGVREDLKAILKYEPKRPLYLVMHDSFNPDCRRGILEAPWKTSEFVHYLEIDFAPGWFYPKALGYAGSKSLWGGFALAVLLPYKRSGDLAIRQSQKELFDTGVLNSGHASRRQRIVAALNSIKNVFSRRG